RSARGEIAGIQGLALTNPDPTRVAHLVIVGESPNRGCCVRKRKRHGRYSPQFACATV
ncbi:hypothetical protein CCACVL1_03573, partial [Corchorus capsularis]